MKNDALKNKIAPWQEKGRWYHLKVISDGIAWTIDKDHSDDVFSNSLITGALYVDLKFTRNYSIVDIKAIQSSTTNGLIALYSNYYIIRLATTGPQISLPPLAAYTGESDIYLFCIPK